MSQATIAFPKPQNMNCSVCVDSEQCKGCGLCIAHCSLGVFEEGSALNKLGYAATNVAHPEKCVGCGNCFYSCPEIGAIRLTVWRKQMKKSA